MNEQAAREYLKSHLPKLEESNEPSLLPGDEITRVWEGVPPDKINDILEYLNKYSDVCNDGTPSKRVDSELKFQSGGTRTGKWRVFRNLSGRDANNGNSYFIKQVLRSGYLQTADFLEAYIFSMVYARTNTNSVAGVSNASSATPAIQYEIRFPNIAPDLVENVRAGLDASTISGPVVQDAIGLPVELSGTWNVINAKDKQEDDGSHSIYLTIAQSIFVLFGYSNSDTPRASDDYYIYNVPLDLTQQIATDFKSAYGPRCTVSFSHRNEDKFCDMIFRKRLAPATSFSGMSTETSCRFRVTTDFYFGVADPALYDIPTSSENTPGVTYEKDVRGPDSDGLYDIVVRTRYRQNQTLSFLSENDASKTTIEAQDLGRTTTPDPLTFELGKIKRRSININEDCTKDVVDRTTTPIDQTSDSFDVAPSGVTQETLHTESVTELPQPASETGKIKKVSNTPTEAGNYRTVLSVETPADQLGSSTEESPAKTETVVTHTEGAELSAPASVQGKIRRNISEPTRAGNFATRSIETTPKDQTSSDFTDSAAAASQSTKHTESSTQATGSAAAGTIRRITNLPTEAGNYRTEDTVITPKDQVSTDAQDDAAESSITTKHTESPVEITGAAASGTRRIITNLPTEAGNFRTEDRVVTAKDQTSSASQSSAAQTVATSRHTENPTQVSGSASAGTIRRINNVPTPFGNYATEDVVITPLDQQSAHQTDSAAASSTTTRHTENATQVSGSAAPGTIRKITNFPTEAGNFLTEDQVVTPKDQQANSSADNAFASSATEHHTENATPVTGSAATGTVRRIINRVTEAGNFETSDEVETAKNVANARVSSTVNADESRAVILDRGQATAATMPSSHSDGAPIIEAVALLTEHGRYDNTTQTDTPLPAWDSGLISYTDTDGTNYIRLFINQPDPALMVAGIPDTFGISLRPQRNKYGLFDGIVTAKPQDFTGALLNGIQTFEVEFDTYKWQFATVGGTRKRRKISLHIGIKQTTSETAARNFIQSATGEVGKIVSLFGGRMFKATYCNITDFGTWVDDE